MGWTRHSRGLRSAGRKGGSAEDDTSLNSSSTTSCWNMRTCDCTPTAATTFTPTTIYTHTRAQVSPRHLPFARGPACVYGQATGRPPSLPPSPPAPPPPLRFTAHIQHGHPPTAAHAATSLWSLQQHAHMHPHLASRARVRVVVRVCVLCGGNDDPPSSSSFMSQCRAPA